MNPVDAGGNTPAYAVVEDNWQRYEYGLYRGHLEYVQRAARCNRFWLGGGGQWEQADKDKLDAEGRPYFEMNEILPALNSAFGYQISNRMDITFRPRNGKVGQDLADLRSKMAMQIADNNTLHWVETGVFMDGMIEQRGYFDVRMGFDDNVFGELRITDLDPRDVIPDPDAKGYDPATWADVITTRWMSLDEIERMFGEKARKEVENMHPEGSYGERDFGDAEWGDSSYDGERSKFGSTTDASASSGTGYYSWLRRDKGLARFRVIDRQKRVFRMAEVLVTPLGDIRSLTGATAESVERELAQGAQKVRRMVSSVHWTVTTRYAVLHDAESPYDRFTVVPFFPYFRRGQTRGMVDAAIDPQQILNKTMSQIVHILNSVANSGWVVEKNSLTNMTTEDLEEFGAQNGLVIEYAKGTNPPQKIQASSMPAGLDQLVERVTFLLKEVTVPDAMRGTQGAEISGIALQSRQSASQQQLAVPLDSLSRSRAMLAGWIDYAIRSFYDAPRVLRITKQDPATGQQKDSFVNVNQPNPDGTYNNDMSVGEYDVVVSERPAQVTFENSQFMQALEMRKNGVRIPDSVLIEVSNLSRKPEIMEAMSSAAAANPEQMALTQAQTGKLMAETERVRAETVNKLVESAYSAIQTANVAASTPATAGMADSLLKSAGFVDKDAAPIVPEAAAAMGIVDTGMPANTNPTTPANPGVGIMQGIETAETDGVNGAT